MMIARTLKEMMERKGWRGPLGVLRVLKLYIWDAYVLVLFAQSGPPPWVPFFHRCRGMRIGREVFIDRSVLTDGIYPDLITIEDEARIGPGAALVCHTAAGKTLRERGVPYTVKPIRLCRYCMVGANATVLGGVTLGEGAVVAAGAVVSQDVPPYTVVAGNPARPVKKLSPPPVS
jgi:acetyltransferase-like isoleucine patch superfamily enzyme